MTDKLTIAQSAIETARTAKGILEIQGIDDLWIQNYQATSGKQDGRMKFENEKLHFLKAFQMNAKLDALSPFSKFAAFFDLCSSNLSLANEHGYILSMDNKNVVFFPSWHGRLEQIRQMPQITFAYDPEVVYDCDEYAVLRDGAVKKINHVENGKSERTKESKIIAVYMYIEFDNGKTIPYEMKALDVENIRDTRSKPYIQYIKGLVDEKLNKNKKFGDRITIQYKKDGNWANMDIDPPMAITDAAQYFKKTLVRRVYKTLPKTARQIELDQKLSGIEDIEHVEEEIDTTVKNTAEPEEPGYTSYEEVADEKTDLSEEDVEGDEF